MQDRESSVGESESIKSERETSIMFGEEQQQLMQGSGPWVYTNEEEMSKGHNEDAPPQPVVPHVEEPETDVVLAAVVPRGSGEFTPGGPHIFV